MARVKRGTKARARRKKVLKRAKGYYGSNSRLFVTAQEVVDRALVYAYRDRKVRKREFRSLWTVRINAAARQNGTTYSKLMGAIHKAGIEVDRKILADLAVTDAPAFAFIVKQALGGAASAGNQAQAK
jgi:large subunit ribosomal protein L20